MSLTYGSRLYLGELKKRINENEDYRTKARGMNWKTLMIVKDVPFATYAEYADGELVEQSYIPDDKLEEYRKDADFIVYVPTYDLFVEMARGTKSLETLFLTGNIRAEGSLFKAIQYRAAIEVTAKITANLVNETHVLPRDQFTKMLHDEENARSKPA